MIRDVQQITRLNVAPILATEERILGETTLEEVFRVAV